MSAYPRVVPFGEGGLLVEFGDAVDLAANAAVHALARALQSAAPAGLRALVPGYASLLVLFDPLANSLEPHIARALSDVSASAGSRLGALPGRVRRIPVVYGGERGPDLAAVASHLGLTSAEVVSRHVQATLTVYMLGFAPGHPYIGDLPPEFATLRRLDTPRQRVPRGSVGVVGRQSVIYSQSTPGGWRIIGQTPIDLWDVRRAPPAYLAPGDRIQCVPIEASEWQHHRGPAKDW